MQPSKKPSALEDPTGLGCHIGLRAEGLAFMDEGFAGLGLWYTQGSNAWASTKTLRGEVKLGQ